MRSLSLVGFSSVRCSHDRDGQLRVEHVIDHPVVINPNAPDRLLANELFRTGGRGSSAGSSIASSTRSRAGRESFFTFRSPTRFTGHRE